MPNLLSRLPPPDALSIVVHLMHLTAYDWSSAHFTHTRNGQPADRGTRAHTQREFGVYREIFTRKMRIDNGTIMPNRTKRITKTNVTDNNGRATDNGELPAMCSLLPQQ